MATYAAYRHVELDHVGYGKRRVLKPPGGGSSDIFGTTEQQQSPRKVKQYMASNVILSDDVPPSSGPGSTASSTSSSGSAPDTPSSPTRNEGNPVTGEGYAQQNGQGKSNGSPAPSAPRSRVPPGGYSSGLW